MAGTLADAWAMWKSDRDLLLPVVGLLLFLPLFAVLLLVPPMAPVTITADMTDAARQMAAEVVTKWFVTYAGWILLASVIVQFGTLVVLALYLQADRPDLGAALARSTRLFPRYLPVMILVSMPLQLGQLFVLFLLPGLYLFGRLLLVGPSLVAEPRPSIRRAIRASWSLTRGHGMTAAAFGGIVVFGGIAGSLLEGMDRRLTAANMANPMVIAMIDAAAAGATAAAMLAIALVQIAFYRRLLSSPVSNRGI